MEGPRTKRRSLLAVVVGVLAGTLLWYVSILASEMMAPGNEWSVALVWFPYALFFGFSGWVVASLISAPVRRGPSAIGRLRVIMPASGLAVSIFGVALSFTCDPTSCRIHPLERYGIVLSAIGLFVFLAGLTLAAAFPPEKPSVT